MERVIRGFKLLEPPIARGGMAVVYKAIQLSVDRPVAVKELHSHLVLQDDKEFIDRFSREAKAAANLHHENIIIIHDYGFEGNSYIIAMEYVEGKSLKDLLTDGKKLPVVVALNISAQICKGLEHAHNKGVIHRDIKPANIMIAYDGYVKIADFGLAHSSHMPSLTVTGATLGTPAYMSPEQAAGNRKADQRADIFSLGAVMYEMVTGIKPFMAETYPATITRIITHNPDPVRTVNPAVPAEFSQVIERCLYKDVDRRYENVSEMLRELQFCAEKNKLTLSNYILKEFVNNPEEFEKKYNTILVRQFMDKGLYFMNLGRERFDDAIQMFSNVLLIQPDHALAKEYLEKLNNEKKKIQERPKPAVLQQKRPEQVKRAEGKRRTAWVPLAIGAALLIVAGLLFAMIRFGGEPELLQQSALLRDEPVLPEAPGVTPSSPLPKGPPMEEGTKEEPVATEQAKAEEAKQSVQAPVKTNKPPEVEKRGEPKKARKEEPPRIVAVEMKHEPPPPPKPPEPAQPTEKIEYSYLMVKVNPWADVYIDGKLMGRTPLEKPLQVTVGQHEIRLFNPYFREFKKTIKFKPKTPDAPFTINISLEPVGGR